MYGTNGTVEHREMNVSQAFIEQNQTTDKDHRIRGSIITSTHTELTTRNFTRTLVHPQLGHLWSVGGVPN